MDNKELSAEEKLRQVILKSIGEVTAPYWVKLGNEVFDSENAIRIGEEILEAAKLYHREELINLRDNIQWKADLYSKGKAVEFTAYKMGLETTIEIIDNRIEKNGR